MTPAPGAVELSNGYWWIGSKQVADKFQCNPYLLVEGDEAVLFDPGSVLDFQEVKENLVSLISLDKVKYVVLHHQDPDLASSVPLFEAEGMHFTIVTHWRTWSQVRFYGVQSPSYLVDEHDYSLILATGRKLQFITTPYLHFPGAIVSYDRKAKILVSSDLFGAFQSKWALYADESYMEGMKAFHEHYMPSNDILRPVMEFLGSLNISMILPQHGSIIKDNPKLYIDALAGLDCGKMLGPMKAPERQASDFKSPFSRLLKRVSALFGADKAQAIAAKTEFSWNPDTGILKGDFSGGMALWDRLVEELSFALGHEGLSVLEPFIASLCEEYSLHRPPIYDFALKASRDAGENLSREVAKLKEMNEQLNLSATAAQRSLMMDPVTGLNNEAYFRTFIEEEVSMRLYSEGVEDYVLAVIGVDEGMSRIEYQYGPKEVEAILRGIGRIIQDTKRSSSIPFRLHGASFALWMPFILFHEASELCDGIRTKVEASKTFIEPVTVSIGLVALAEIREKTDPAEAGSTLSEIGIRRLRDAKKCGGNLICSTSEIVREVEAKARILVVDDDTVNADVIKTFLENADYTVAEARDGDEALKKIGEEGFDLIISELMLSKIDGFMLKESLSKRSGTKDIPFIILSHLKDESAVERAYRLGINYYLRKPFLLAELLGMVQNLVAPGAAR
ncbi:MAG: response regulator [Spirochaetes bacterium]|nr:response regulator [Spirochaetota bacterium]